MEEKKNYGKLVKVLQIAAGVMMLAMVVLCIVLIQKYNIKVSNIPELSKMITGGTATIAFVVIAFSVVKSFALVFPPAVVFSICAYMMPDYFSAFLVNLVSVALSLAIPYFLGKFTGAGMVDTLKGKFKAIKKLDDFAGANEMQTVFVVKLSGLLPGDLSSLLFGAMNTSFKNFFIGANLGMLPLVIVYTGFGTALKTVGEKPWLTAIPVVAIVVFVLISSLITKNMVKKNKVKQQENVNE
ncbi:MAG: TVP38/TMEM64 family protein [Ruminococcaceae bacterium]|nr:TVP38/TMEM64 family protein [Oscillospiraceae bacterium]